MNLLIHIPEKYKEQNIMDDIRLKIVDGKVDVSGYEHCVLPDNLCTQVCCLKNHNEGIIECDEICSNRTTFWNIK